MSADQASKLADKLTLLKAVVATVIIRTLELAGHTQSSYPEAKGNLLRAVLKALDRAAIDPEQAAILRSVQMPGVVRAGAFKQAVWNQDEPMGHPL